MSNNCWLKHLKCEDFMLFCVIHDKNWLYLGFVLLVRENKIFGHFLHKTIDYENNSESQPLTLHIIDILNKEGFSRCTKQPWDQAKNTVFRRINHEMCVCVCVFSVPANFPSSMAAAVRGGRPIVQTNKGCRGHLHFHKSFARGVFGEVACTQVCLVWIYTKAFSIKSHHSQSIITGDRLD